MVIVNQIIAHPFPGIKPEHIGGFPKENVAPRSKSPTRQSRYGDGALQGILAQANNKQGVRVVKFYTV
jgi:hypothetical protein